MVKTDVETPEAAVISGSTDDVEYVLAVTGELGELSAYLIPLDIVEKEFRTRQRAWMDEDPENRSNTTWSLSGLAERFSQYEYDLGVRSITPEEAKRRRAVHFETTPDKINISVSV